MACEDLVAAGHAVIVPNQLWVSSARCGIELVEPRPSCGACSEGDERAPRDGGRAGLQGGNATVLGLCWSAVVGALAAALLKSYEPGWAAAQVAAEAAGRHDSMEAAAQALAAESYTRTALPRPRKLGRRR